MALPSGALLFKEKKIETYLVVLIHCVFLWFSKLEIITVSHNKKKQRKFLNFTDYLEHFAFSIH